MAEVVLYTTDGCLYCVLAKRLLARKEAPYREAHVPRSDPDAYDELTRLTGGLTFPQVVIDGEVVGGFAELQALDADGRLDAMLAG